MARSRLSPEVRPGNPQDESRPAELCAGGATGGRKRIRPTMAAFRELRAERDAARTAVAEGYSKGREMAETCRAMKAGLENLEGRILDIEAAASALAALNQHRTENSDAPRRFGQRLDAAEQWIIRHLMAEIEQAGETVENAAMGRPTTARGPVAVVEGGAA